MYIVFIATVIGGLWFFLLRRRVFDFVSAGFFGCVVYFMPGFTGLLFNPYYPDEFPIEPAGVATYGVWTAALLGSIAAGVVYNPQPLQPSERVALFHPFTTNIADVTINVILMLSFLVALATGGQELFSPDKNDVLSVQDRSIILFSTLNQVTLPLFFIQRKYFMSIPPALCLAFLIFIGFRAEFAIAALCIMVTIAYRNGIRSLMRYRNILPAVAAVLFLFGYKFLYIDIKSGRLDLAIQTILDSQFFPTIFLKSEPYITQSILNEVIARNFSIRWEDFSLSFLSILPLSNVITSISTDQIAFNFQEQLFPNLKYGVASNIYANFYAALGYFGILCYILAQNSALIAISRAMRPPNGFRKLALALVGAFLAFYIHRNDIANSITLINRNIYCCLGLWLIVRTVAIFEPASPTARVPR